MWQFILDNVAAYIISHQAGLTIMPMEALKGAVQAWQPGK